MERPPGAELRIVEGKKKTEVANNHCHSEKLWNDRFATVSVAEVDYSKSFELRFF